jgi:3-hydroxyisobutyrate dehydrogenase-like beta-hydroxyacid dehydrogenase
MSEHSVGIVGVGNMGGRIGRRLSTAGRAPAAFDRDAERLTESGLAAASTLAELVERADVILLSLPDSAIIERVVLGEDGIETHCRSGQIVVDLSTASPESTMRIHDALAAKDVAYLDAGISGGAAAAEAGTLTLMVGGSATALEAVRPVLADFSSKIVHMGASGSGHVAKVLNNFLNGVSLAATAEVMVAARKAGLDLERFLDVVNSSSGVNFATLNRFPSIIKGDYLEGGLSGRLMVKDILLYLDYVGRIGVPTFNGPACLATFEVTNALGYADQISNRVVDGLGDLAGGVRLHDTSTDSGGQE